MPILGEDIEEKAPIVVPPIEIGNDGDNLFGLIDDSLAIKLVKEIMNDAKFKIKLKHEFVGLYCPNETQLKNIAVNKFESTKKTANQDSHFIIEYKGKKYHAKPALHGSGISNNCRYNEAAMYFLLDNLGYGPHVESSVINDVLIIFSEDLSDRSSQNKPYKTTSFQDNIQENLLQTIPKRQKDNIDRCIIELLINLLCLGDLEKNLGNSGVKTSAIKDGTLKQKPFIVDFTIMSDTEISKRASPNNCEEGSFFPDPNFDKVSKVDSAKIYADKIASYLDSKEKDFAYSLFSFKANHDVFQQAIKKLFLDKGIKQSITSSFTKAKNIVAQDDLAEKERNIEELNKQEKILLDCIDAFLGHRAIDLLIKKEFSTQQDSLGKKRLPNTHSGQPVTMQQLKPAELNKSQRI